MMKNFDLMEAFSFYEIENENYISKCKECLLYLKNKSNELETIFNLIYKAEDMSSLWEYKRIQEIVDLNYSMVSCIILLMGYKIHQRTILKLSFDDDQIKIHKKRVKECLMNDIIENNLNDIRLSQLLWGTYFIKGKLIEVGSLQYELYDNNIKIHIPKKTKFSKNEILLSLKESSMYIQKYYNLKTNYNITCESWLLSPQIKEVLDSNSNILFFNSLFDIKQTKECNDDIIKFLFWVVDNKEQGNDIYNYYSNLPSVTKLQILVKKRLLDGQKFYKGYGTLKKIHYKRGETNEC